MNEFYGEYEAICIQDPEFMLAELKVWEKGDKVMGLASLEELAVYADYVTRKIIDCGEEMIIPSLQDCDFKPLTKPFKKLGSCALGNAGISTGL